MNFKEICLQVVETARETGKWMAAERLKFDDSSIEFKGLHDLVSYVDKQSERRIVDSLSLILPEAGFIAEEGTSTKVGELYNWIIDPLDGTTNYIQGIPVYSVSIALKKGEELVVGVVYEVGRDESFYAWKGGKAWLNGVEIAKTDTTPETDTISGTDYPKVQNQKMAQAIHCSSRDNMHHGLLATGFPYTNFAKLGRYMEFLKWTMENSRGVRRLGSAAVDLAYVACGRFDAFWEYDLKAWDVAAGALIVKEAGGKVSDFKGEEDYVFGREIIASNIYLYDTILGKLQSYMLD